VNIIMNSYGYKDGEPMKMGKFLEEEEEELMAKPHSFLKDLFP